jgi:predicted outer membrane repeat protein
MTTSPVCRREASPAKTSYLIRSAASLDPIPRPFGARVGEAVNIYWGRGQGIVTKAPEVPPDGPIQVDTLSDIDDGNYSENNQSLREALRRAGELSGSITIPVRVTGTINLTRPLTLSGGNGSQIRLRVARGSLVLDGGEQTRIFTVPAGKRLLLDGLTLSRGRDASASGGGAALHNAGELILENCLLSWNTAEHRATSGGGAVFNAGQLTVRRSEFYRNRSGGEESRAGGGAIRNEGTLLAEDCLFQGNISIGSGGAISAPGGSSTWLHRCLFTYNISPSANHRHFWAPDKAGNCSIYNLGLLEMSNCLDLALQTSVLGRGRLRHCTFTSATGANLLVADDEGMDLDHCMVFAQRVPSTSVNLFMKNPGGLRSQGYNLIQTPGEAFEPALGGTDIIGQLPIVDFSSEQFTLVAYSPGVNDGNPAIKSDNLVPSLRYDLFGRERVADVIDIGAIEVGYDKLRLLLEVLVVLGDVDGNGIPDAVDILSGRDPTENDGKSKDMPLTATPETITEPVAVFHVHGPKETSGTERATVQVRIDERATFTEGTLQFSNDMVDWSDYATYRPLGIGGGVLRTAEADAGPAVLQPSGYGWFIEETLPLGAQSRYYRLNATVLSGEGTPVVTINDTPLGRTGELFTFQVEAEGATSFDASGLPAGLSMDAATGLISGIPTQTGSFPVKLAGSNAAGIGEVAELLVVILPGT